jgi:PDZ domain-containing protein
MRSKFKPKLTGTLLILLGIAMFIPVPYVLTTPGPVFNTIGKEGDTELISISGTQTFPTQGELNMTTVRETGGPQDGLDLFQAIWGWLDPDSRVVPRAYFYPEDQTEAENAARSAEAFSTSQSYSIAAAMKYLDKPVLETIVITSVGVDTPALDKLRAGDEIISVDAVEMASPEQVVAAVRAKPIGTKLVFVVNREGTQLTQIVTSIPKPDDPGTAEDESKIPYIGIGIDRSYAATFPIDFGVSGVGGPSAGSMFAVGIVDKLTPGALTEGKIIAGTGTIDPIGNVGEIGGIQQKLIGARKAGAVLFLAPQSNCVDVIGHIPDGLTVASVATLADAITAINNFNNGQQVKPCTGD